MSASAMQGGVKNASVVFEKQKMHTIRDVSGKMCHAIFGSNFGSN